MSPVTDSRSPLSPGFSLIEMAIAVTLIGILTAVSMPAIQAASARNAVVTAADETVGKIALARSTAVRYGRTARLELDDPTARIWVEVDTTLTGSGTRVTVGGVSDFSDDDVTMSSSRSFICFDGRGLATELGDCPGGDVRVVFTRGEYADTVETTPVGKVLR